MLINMCLGSAKHAFVQSYVDDLLIYSPNDFQVHLQHVQDIFTRLLSANLRLKISKCTFATGECEFLGHIVGREGIKCDPKKVEAVSKLARPETKKQVRTFLGMCGYYRDMIPGFSMTAAPLDNKTRLSNPDKIEWDEECEEAFNKLKQSLTSGPLLQFPDFRRDFIVECDASRTGIGGVLMQETGDGMKAPVAYTSRLTSSAEKNYSVFDLDLLAIVHSCQRYRPYLIGKHFQLFSDQRSLQSLLNLKRPSGRLACWLMILSEFDFSLKWKRGVDNKCADALSRLRQTEASPTEITVRNEKESGRSPLALTNEDFLEPDVEEEKVPSNDDDEMVQAQVNDDFCGKCIEYLKEGALPEDVKEANFITAHARMMGLHAIKEGEPPSLLTHHYDTVGEFRRRIRRVQIVVPENEEIRKKILRWAHGAGTTGHIGAQKAFSILRSAYWWRNMYASLVSYIRLCDSCQRMKDPVARLRVRARPCKRPMPRGVFDTVHLDGAVIAGTTVILFVCAFSKYPEVYISPKKDMTGRMLGEAFLSKVVARHGCPRVVVHDSVSYQKQGEFPELLRMLGVIQKPTIPFRPSSNGCAESKIKAIKSLLRSVAREHPSRWKSMMPFCLLIYRCTFHRSIGMSPFYMVHGRSPHLPG
ncbi:unnamed protein product, partial [Heterosigma akashiwo]